MKITQRDLDENLLDKINRFDTVIKEYSSSSSGDNFISYNGSGFHLKNSENIFLKKIYTEDELIDLQDSIHKKNKNISSSSYSDLRLDNKFNAALESLATKTVYSANIKLKNIVLCKHFSNSIGVLDSNGNFIKIVEKKILTSINILEKLKSNFNITSSLYAFGIVDIAEINENEYAIATGNFGIYKLNISTNEIELIINTDKVKKIEYLHTKNLLVATENACLIVDIASGKIIEKDYTVYNSGQIPVSIVKTINEIFILGAPIGPQNLNNIVHGWILDDAKISYNSIDSKIQNNPRENDYQVMFMNYDNSFLYLTGKFHNKIFVWKYNLIDFSLDESFIDCITCETYDGFIPYNDTYCILIEGHFFIIKNNTIQENLILPNKCNSLKLIDGEILSVAKNLGLAFFAFPKYSSSDDIVEYSVLDNNEPCNNIDIFVEGATRAERITILDINSGSEIIPSFYMVYNGNSVIKLLNCQSTKIKMLINVSKESSITGIAIKKNRVFSLR